MIYLYSGTPGFLLTRPLRDVTHLDSVLGMPPTFLLTRPLRDVTLRRVNQVI